MDIKRPPKREPKGYKIIVLNQMLIKHLEQPLALLRTVVRMICRRFDNGISALFTAFFALRHCGAAL
ncbi:MAG: hypothetical protein K2Y31_07550 [Burkholderiales bacterium]|jgi:hypothetical protein|nr:hypothetical protein [Burkholderiales bacterium]